jgi:two-component system alkaline phosphatase synthesis response regulator PhoP
MSKILFIDEEVALVNMYRDIFEKKKYEFVTTFDIKKALEIAELEKPNIILLDIVIPTPDNVIAEQGYDFLKIVKSNSKTKNIPIVVFSNLNTPQDRQKCRELGAAAFAFKRDCSPKEVLETVEEVIKRSKIKGSNPIT